MGGIEQFIAGRKRKVSQLFEDPPIEILQIERLAEKSIGIQCRYLVQSELFRNASHDGHLDRQFRLAESRRGAKCRLHPAGSDQEWQLQADWLSAAARASASVAAERHAKAEV